MRSPGAGDPSSPEGSLLVPFRIRHGSRVLDVGAASTDLARSLVDRGLDVVAVEALAGDAPPDGPFDLAIIRGRLDPDGTMEGGTHDTAVSRATALLDADGVLLVAIDRPRTVPVGAGATEAAARIREALSAAGLSHQVWSVRYPDAGPDLAIVSERLWEHPDATSLLHILVRDPVLPGADVARDIEAFDAAADREVWLGLASRWLVAAAYDESALDAISREGLAWVRHAGRAASWDRTRELVLVDGAWTLRSVGGRVVRSGPLTLEPLSAMVPVGANGEDVLARELLGWGPAFYRTREAFQAWWAAVEELIAESPVDRRPLDVQPRNFVVTPDGRWQHVAQELTFRFGLPNELVAFRALLDLVTRRVLPVGWIPDLPRDSSVADAVSSVMSVLDLVLDDAIVTLWQELEADIAIRTGQPAASRAELLAALAATVRQPVEEILADFPASRHIAGAAILAERAREIRWLHEELDRMRGEARTLRETTEQRGVEVAALSEQVARQGAEIESLSAERLQRGAEIDSLHVELAERRLAIDALDLQLASRTQVIDGLRHELAMGEAHLEAAQAEVDRRDAELDSLRRELILTEAWAARPRPKGRTRALQQAAMRLREDNAREIIAASGYFDRTWYMLRYPDVGASRLDPIIHYLRHGAAEGRDPSPRFDTRAYIALNPDVAASGVNPLLHFLRAGSAEGRAAPMSRYAMVDAPTEDADSALADPLEQTSDNAR